MTLKNILTSCLVVIGFVSIASPAWAGGGGRTTSYEGRIIYTSQHSNLSIGRLKISLLDTDVVNNLRFVCSPSDQLKSLTIVGKKKSEKYTADFLKRADGLYEVSFQRPIAFSWSKIDMDGWVTNGFDLGVRLNLNPAKAKNENIYCSLDNITLFSNETGEVLDEGHNSVFINGQSVVRTGKGQKDFDKDLTMKVPLRPYYQFTDTSYADRYFYLGEATLNGVASQDCPMLKKFYAPSDVPSGKYCLKVPANDPSLSATGLSWDYYRNFASNKYGISDLEFVIDVNHSNPNNAKFLQNLGKQVSLKLANFQLPMSHVFFPVTPQLTKVN